MDKKDKRILSELSKNSRIPITQLSRKVRLSREVVEYRLKNLRKRVVKLFSTVIDIKSLGYKRINFYLSLKHHSVKFREEFLKFIISHKYIAAISTNIGKYDFIFEIFFKDQDQLYKIIYEIEEFARGKIKSYFMLNLPVELYFFHNKLFGVNRSFNYKRKSSNTRVDKVGKEILKILNENSRENLINMSKKMDINPNAIGYRIKNLQKKGVIRSYTLFFDYYELGYEIYDVQIKVRNLRDFGRIESFLKSHFQVFYYYKYSGNKEWDFDIGVFAENKIDLRNLIHDLKELVGDIIDIKDIYLVDEIYKEQLPEGVFT